MSESYDKLKAQKDAMLARQASASLNALAMKESINDAIRRILGEGGTPFQIEQRLTALVRGRVNEAIELTADVWERAGIKMRDNTPPSEDGPFKGPREIHSEGVTKARGLVLFLAFDGLAGMADFEAALDAYGESIRESCR